MKPKFEIFKAKNRQYYFRLKAKNGKIIAQSEGYMTKASALKGIAALQNCAAAEVLDLTKGAK